MENSRKKYFIISGLVLALLALILVSAMINGRRSSQSGDEVSTSPSAAIVKYPKSYADSPISDKYLTQAVEKYRNEPDAPESIYQDTVDYIERYFIYKDVLAENNVDIPEVDESSMNAIVDAVPVLHKLVVENLISQTDFVYIKARFKLYPTFEIEEQVKKEVPNVQEKARILIERYRLKLSGEIVNAQQILTEANSDPEMTQINYEDKGEFIRGYTTNQNLFFTDPNFNQFLFSQTRGNVSSVYDLKQEGQTYAYLIVYPTSLTVKKYKTVDDIINEKRVKFNY